VQKGEKTSKREDKDILSANNSLFKSLEAKPF